nr:hypothetical protein [Bdellovibrionales bacterium]
MLRHALSLCLLLGFSGLVNAAEVVKVKGESVLIDLRGDAAAPGDEMYVLRSDGKRAGIVRITRVKGEKAIARLAKGKASAGMSLEPKGASSASASKKSSGGGFARGQKTRSYWGGLLGISQDSMTAKIYDAADNDMGSVSLSGMGFSAKGLFDYELFNQIWFRGTTGLEGFSVSGDAKCGDGNAQSCTANIWYLSFDFIGRYVFSTGNFRPWLGGGLGLLFPASKDAKAIDPKSIGTT